MPDEEVVEVEEQVEVQEDETTEEERVEAAAALAASEEEYAPTLEEVEARNGPLDPHHPDLRPDPELAVEPDVQ